MKDEEIVDRARMARDVLDSPVYTGAYEQIEAGIIEAWRDARSSEDREHLHRMLVSLQKVRKVIESTMQAGKLAEDALKRKQTVAGRIGAPLRKAWRG